MRKIELKSRPQDSPRLLRAVVGPIPIKHEAEKASRKETREYRKYQQRRVLHAVHAQPPAHAGQAHPGEEETDGHCELIRESAAAGNLGRRHAAEISPAVSLLVFGDHGCLRTFWTIYAPRVGHAGSPRRHEPVIAGGAAD